MATPVRRPPRYFRPVATTALDGPPVKSPNYQCLMGLAGILDFVMPLIFTASSSRRAGISYHASPAVVRTVHDPYDWTACPTRRKSFAVERCERERTMTVSMR